MKKTGLLLIALLGLNLSRGSAEVVTFFGEDLNRAGDPAIATPNNASAASGRLFANLSNVGTETFEEYATKTFVPLTVNFGTFGSAVLSGTGTVVGGNDGGGRFPVSGTQYLLTDAGAGFNLAFTSPVSAFGFYGTDIGDYGGQIVLTLTDTTGELTTMTVPNTIGDNGSTSGSVLYYGFYDLSKSYTNIAFSDTSATDIFAWDNISIGTPQPLSAAPEPGEFALMGLGLLAVFAIRKVKKSR